MIDTFLAQIDLVEFWGRLVNFLPRALAATALLLVGWLVARLLSALVARMLKKLGLDALAERSALGSAMAGARLEKTASQIIGLLLFWLLFLSFAILALEQLRLTAILDPLQRLIAYLPHVLAALLVLLLGAILAQWAGRVTQAAAASVGIEFAVALGQGLRWLLLVIFTIVALEQLGLDVSLISETLLLLLTIAAASLGLAFALGGRKIPRNVLAGYYARELYMIGERLVVDGEEGTLDRIGPLNTELRVGEDRLVVPNTDLVEKAVRVRGAAERQP